MERDGSVGPSFNFLPGVDEVLDSGLEVEAKDGRKEVRRVESPLRFALVRRLAVSRFATAWKSSTTARIKGLGGLPSSPWTRAFSAASAFLFHRLGPASFQGRSPSLVDDDSFPRRVFFLM